MQAFFKNNKFPAFLIISSSLYILLYLFYQFFIKRHTFIDQQFIRIIINSSDLLLHLFGYTTFKILRDTDFQAIGIDGSLGVWVGSGCNALTLFFLFAVFIIAYPGHQKSKWWFVPFGILSIHLLNILRVVALAMIAFYSPGALSFNHTYTFTFVVYGYIFLLWMWWVNSFSNRETTAAG
ncbi:MAG: exosortase X [Bacteroidia bacterium]